ncbi:MAG: gamma carbonic anhydrase family protein [Bacillota bacterium]|jgi:carbonic anhydrase/acetyltransferase-like protein (isoleucine patch superfamily)|nr:gamma carbonic anhydrase family protein [Bacillota bacterium]NLU55182.1 gamma carbonic anhydrase family protein [Bacillota bacterium]HOA91274.1 gamma carbonic anhydrase family protein [Bacillota bacterium]HOJ46816.1 gamma carbonic anhydrase family protein [Bacillota bacterium]HPQ10107.1 gamma carbonic anhydrase family protein [Bacillota bacterium]
MIIGLNVRKAESAVVVGDVVLSDNVSIWYNAVVRGDIAPIRIGKDSNVQENAVIHVSRDIPVSIGERVTIGHGAIIHSCTIEDDVLIGMGATILDGAVVGQGAMIGAGALVGPGKVIPPNSLVVGIPGKVVRELTPEELEANRENIREYLEISSSLPEFK